MSRWFRFYDDAINDPKILKLPEATRWSWVALLCIASKNDGKLPAIDDIALMLRTTPAKAAATIAALVQATLLDRVGDGYAPHNWDARQFKSDTSNERVKRYRNGKRNVTGNVTVAAPYTEQTQSRTDTEARDVSRETELRVSITQAFEQAGSPSAPDTSRAALWLEQGYEPNIILPIISEIVKKKPGITSLSYFDTPIKEAHAVKSDPKQTYVGQPAKIELEEAVRLFAKTRVWSKYAPCGEPGQSTCTASAELLARYGLAPDGSKLQAH